MGSLALHMNLNIFRENEGRSELNVIIVRKGLLSTPASKRDWLANCVDTRASFAGRFNAVLFFSKMHQTRRPWLKKKKKKRTNSPLLLSLLKLWGLCSTKAMYRKRTRSIQHCSFPWRWIWIHASNFGFCPRQTTLSWESNLPFWQAMEQLSKSTITIWGLDK